MNATREQLTDALAARMSDAQLIQLLQLLGAPAEVPQIEVVPAPALPQPQEFTFKKDDVNIGGLCREFSDVLGADLEGVAQNGETITVTVKAGVDVQPGVLEAIMQAHKGGEADDVKRWRKQQEATDQLTALDFAAIRQGIAQMTDAKLKQALNSLLQVILLMAAAQGYADPDVAK